MMRFGSRLFEYCAAVRGVDDDCVCSEYQAWFSLFCIVDFLSVDGLCLFGGCRKHVVDGAHGFGEVFWLGAGDDFEVGQA